MSLATVPEAPLVLVVEDEAELVEVLEMFLRQAGFRTERAPSAEQGWALFLQARPDVVLLDIGLPGEDGLELLQRLRRDSDIPVIMLTARAQDLDELVGFRLGADDYVTKPFVPQTLIARIRAVLRRGRAHRSWTRWQVGPLEVDEDRVLVLVDDRPIDVTPTEFRLLAHLARMPGRAVSRQELLEAAVPESDALDRAIDVHMKNIRQKLSGTTAAEQLETVRGVGYRLAERPRGPA